MMAHMLTTDDNPFDPFTQFDEWRSFDESMGYHTCAYLARVTVSSDEMSEGDQMRAQELAIDEAVDLNLTGNYKKVSRDLPEPGVIADTGIHA